MEPPATRSVCGVRAAFPEAWQRGSWHCPFATATIIKKTTFNHGPLSASHNLMYFSSLSERSGRRRPPAERSAVYTNNTTDSSTIVNGTGGCLLVPGERRFLWSRSWGLNLLGSGRTTYYCFSYHLAGCSQSLHLNSGDVGGRGVVIQTSAVVCAPVLVHVSHSARVRVLTRKICYYSSNLCSQLLSTPGTSHTTSALLLWTKLRPEYYSPTRC